MQLPAGTDPQTISEDYSCDSDAAQCMLGQCDECNDHGLKPDDFEKTFSAGHSGNFMERSVFTSGKDVTMAT